MAELTLKQYFDTGSSSFSLLEHDDQYVTHADLTVDNLRWYRFFTEAKAKTIKLPGDVLRLDRRGFDCIAVARFCLAQGGRLLIPIDEDRHADFDAWVERLSPLGLALRLHEGVVEAHRVAETIPPAQRGPVIYAVGDSHVRFLAGRDEISGAQIVEGGIKLYDNISYDLIGLHLGAGLAYALGQYGSQTRATEKIERLLNARIIPPGADMMLSFGEVDCRSHVVRQTELQGLPMEQIVAAVCDTTIDYMQTLATAGYKLHFWGPVAPSWKESNADPRYPICGSFEQRKQATRLFNDNMARLCRERGFGFLSIEQRLYGQDGVTDRRFFCDTVHVSQVARPLLWQALDEAAAG